MTLYWIKPNNKGTLGAIPSDVRLYNPAEELQMLGRVGRANRRALGAPGDRGFITEEILSALSAGLAAAQSVTQNPSIVLPSIPGAPPFNVWASLIRAALDALGFGITAKPTEAWNGPAPNNDGTALNALRTALNLPARNKTTNPSNFPTLSDLQGLLAAAQKNAAVGSAAPAPWVLLSNGTFSPGASTSPLVGALSDLLSTITLPPVDPNYDVNNYLPSKVVGALFSPADWQLRLIQLNRLLKDQAGVEFLPGFGADGSGDYTGSVPDWNNLADRTVQAYKAFQKLPQVAAVNGDSNGEYALLATVTQNTVGDDAQAKVLIDLVNGAKTGTTPSPVTGPFDPVQIAKDWQQWVKINCPKDPDVTTNGLTCIDDLKIRTVKRVQQALLDAGFNPKGIVGGTQVPINAPLGPYVVKQAAGPGQGKATTVTDEMNGTGADLTWREKKGGRWWTATRAAWNQMAQAAKVKGADSYKDFGLAEFQALAAKLPGAKPPPVVDTLATVAITPTNAVIASKGTASFTAIATYAPSGTTKNVTSQAKWASSKPDLLTINSSGVATSTGVNTSDQAVNISAEFTDGATTKPGNVTATVKAPSQAVPQKTLVSVSISPSSADLTTGSSQQFSATATYSNPASTEDVTAAATWESSNTQVATVAKGVVKVVGTSGSTAIKATFNNVASKTAQINVLQSQKKLVSIAISPPGAKIPAGTKQQFKAVATYSNPASTEDVTTAATWSSNKPQILSVDKGLATAVAAGAASVKAELGGVSSVAEVAVLASSCTVPGQTFNTATGNCECPPGQVVRDGKCALPLPNIKDCPNGYAFDNAQQKCVAPAVAGVDQYSNKDYQIRLAIFNRRNPGKIVPQDYGTCGTNDITGEWTENPFTKMATGLSSMTFGKAASSAQTQTKTATTFVAKSAPRLYGTPQMLGAVGTSSDRTTQAYNSFVNSIPTLKQAVDALPLDQNVPMVYGQLVLATQYPAKDANGNDLPSAGSAADVQKLITEISNPCPKPTCGPNEELDGTGKCVPKIPPCPAGSTWDSTTKSCKPDRVDCKPGFQKAPDGSGNCIPIPCKKGFRAAGTNADGTPICEEIKCGADTRLNAAGNGCEPIPPPDVKCPPNMAYDPGEKKCIPILKPVAQASAAGGGNNMLGILALLAGAGALAFIALSKKDEEEEEQPAADAAPGAGAPGTPPASPTSGVQANPRRRRHARHGYRF